MPSPYPFLTVMLVDDSRIDNIINRKVLEREQIAKNILVFEGAVSALTHLQQIDEEKITDDEQIPSVIFLDLVMPEMSGLQFLTQFNTLSDRTRGKMKIVFFSGGIMNNEQRLALENDAAVVKYVPKPLHKKALDEMMAALKTDPSQGK